MRISTPFLAAACILLTIGSLLALISRCCHSHAALLAALLFTLGGLSVGVGVIWFISVVSEEFGNSVGRKTSWVGMYAYWYGWSLGAAGGAGIGALLAALLTAHAHVSRHKPHLSHLCEDALQRPLLRCRSEGCLGGRSCTSDTLRTYLTSDSRRTCGGTRTCAHGQVLDRSPSLVDLTRSSTEGGSTGARPEQQHDTPVSHATSDDDILTIVQQQHQPLQHYQQQRSHCSHSQPAKQTQNDQTDVQAPVNDQSKVQYHYQHQNTHQKHAKKLGISADKIPPISSQREEPNVKSEAIVEAPQKVPSSVPLTTMVTTIHASPSTSLASSLTLANQPLSQPIPQNPHYQTLQPHHHRHHTSHGHHHTFQHHHNEQQTLQNEQPPKQPQHHTLHRSHLIRQSSVPPRASPSLIPATCPPPPSIPHSGPSTTSSVVRQSSSEIPPRLPQLNTFTSASDYSKTLPLKEMRQMAVFSRGNRSTTMSKPGTKASSEV